MESREEEEDNSVRSALTDDHSSVTTDTTDQAPPTDAPPTETEHLEAAAEEETDELVKGNSVARAAAGVKTPVLVEEGGGSPDEDERTEEKEKEEEGHVFIHQTEPALLLGGGGGAFQSGGGAFQPGGDEFTAENNRPGPDQTHRPGPDQTHRPGPDQTHRPGPDQTHRPGTDQTHRPAPPTSLALSGTRPKKKKVLVAPALSLSLGRSESTVSDDFPSAFLSPSTEDEEAGLDFDLDAMETPSDSESLPFPIYDLDLEDDLRRLGVASQRHRGSGPRPGSGSVLEQSGLGALEQEDMVDGHGTRWRCFSTGIPPQESRVNMSVLEPFLRVLSHGGYYGDGMNDIIVFSSCYLPQNSLEGYPYVMDNLFRYVVGTLDLMVSENYVIIYLCAGGQKDKLPGISWLRECYTTINHRLRKNLKGFYVVHPTWYIKALATIIKPFISSKFSRKLQFVQTLEELSSFVPTDHVQIPDCVARYNRSLSR